MASEDIGDAIRIRQRLWVDPSLVSQRSTALPQPLAALLTHFHRLYSKMASFFSRFALVAMASAAAAAPSSGCGAEGLASGVYNLVDANGVQREFTVTVPDGYDSNNPHRLILGIHWWGGSMEDVATGQTVEAGVWNYYGLERLAEGSAIFVAPQGIDGNWYNDNNADYLYMDEIIRTVEEGLCIDTDLRFAIGFSWGGSTSFGLACRDTEFPLRAITAIGAAGPYTCEYSLHRQ